MKFLTVAIILFSATNLYAQKTIHIINNSNSDFDI